jgi:hypothetical protein
VDDVRETASLRAIAEEEPLDDVQVESGVV